MRLENPQINKIEKRDEILEKVKQDLIKQVGHLPEDQQEEKIYEILNKEYGLNLKKEEPEKEITNEENEKDKILKEIAIKLEKRLASIPEKDKGKELERILREEYGVSLQEIEEIKKDKKWGSSLLHYGTILGIVGLAFLGNNLKNHSTKNDKEDEKEINFEKNKDQEVFKIDAIKMPKFDERVYESLPNEGKDVYKYYAEKNPTPDKGYAFLDKKSATLYVFDKENNLLNTIVAGFGTKLGDEKNTSVEYQKGTRTTPAGVYIFSNLSRPEDIVEYGNNQLSLFGISTLGNKEFLGLHQTYNKNNEGDRRMKRLATIDPNDNRFSDGCINISEEDFEKYIKENFKGEGDELLFVLPDAEKGAEFETDKLIKQIKPIIDQMQEKLRKHKASYTNI